MNVAKIIGLWFLMLLGLSFFLLHDGVRPSVVIPFVVPTRTVARLETTAIPVCDGRESITKSPKTPASKVSGVSASVSFAKDSANRIQVEPVPPAPSASPKDMPFRSLPLLDVEPQAPSTETITPIPPLEIERVGLTSELLSTPVIYSSGFDGFGHHGNPSRPVSVPEPSTMSMMLTAFVCIGGGLLARKGKWKS